MWWQSPKGEYGRGTTTGLYSKCAVFWKFRVFSVYIVVVLWVVHNFSLRVYMLCFIIEHSSMTLDTLPLCVVKLIPKDVVANIFDAVSVCIYYPESMTFCIIKHFSLS